MKAELASKTIEELGGPAAFAAWYGVDANAVTMWKVRGFPAATYATMSARLRNEHGISLPPEAWGQRT